jgi:PhzF family phenazine biosynthesis protein
MPQEIVQIDAFTDQLFSGNPAAVCLLEHPADEEWMRLVAREMNLSETAFAVARPDEADTFDLRWFTPEAEVDLCCHATLATAFLLYRDEHLGPHATARFQTRSGLLTATQSPEARVELDFPSLPADAVDPPPGLLEALGTTEPVAVARSAFDYLVEVADPDLVRSLRPDFRALARIEARGVMVTARASDDSGFDLVSRFFGPSVGVDEDPVTGSAHCVLGPWWAAKLDRDELVAEQASARGGTVRVRVAGDRVVLGGDAVIVLRGTLD